VSAAEIVEAALPVEVTRVVCEPPVFKKFIALVDI